MTHPINPNPVPAPLSQTDEEKTLGLPEAVSDNVDSQRQNALYSRIQQYLGVGGFFNPEMMEHDKVRDLLVDIRDFLHPESLANDSDWNGTCECGHLHSEHAKIRSINYTAGTCLVGLCRCRAFIIASDPKGAGSVGAGDSSDASGASSLTSSSSKAADEEKRQ